jgi:hypothetical protein
MDPPTVTLRRTGHREPIVRIRETEGGVNRTEAPHRRAVERGFVTSADVVSSLRIDHADAETAKQFLADTDFDSEFVFVDRESVAQCYRHVLCYVTWTRAELRRTYAEVYRDYDVACGADERDRVARFVRLEGSVDAERVESGVTRTHRGGCPVPRWKRGDRSEDRHPPETADATSSGNPTTAANARPGGRAR